MAWWRYDDGRLVDLDDCLNDKCLSDEYREIAYECVQDFWVCGGGGSGSEGGRCRGAGAAGRPDQEGMDEDNG